MSARSIFFTNVMAAGFLFMAGLSSPLLYADVTITRLANEGVIIDDGETRIMIDGLVVEQYALYGGLPPELAQNFSTATGIFADIDLALASHKHHDHNQPQFACDFLKASTGTKLVTSIQVIELIRERCRPLVRTSSRVGAIDPQYSKPVMLPVGSAEVEVFLLSHGTGKYAKLQNFGHLVRMGGVNILHIGDAAMNPADFATALADNPNIDVALIPFWFFQPGPGMAVVERYMDAPNKIALHIPPNEMAEVTEYMATDYPDVLVMQQPGDAIVISATEVLPE